MPKPNAVLSISAHWYVPETGVTVTTAPKTIHDFGGFPPELYQCDIRLQAIRSSRAGFSSCWPDASDAGREVGPGSWYLVRASARVSSCGYPVVQLSIDEMQPASFHFEVGKKLASLREEGVLIVGSGNLVHNLHAYAWGRHTVDPYDWAIRFETMAREMMVAGEYEPLIDYEGLGREAVLSIPTPDHYLPLLYVLATRQDRESITFPVEGVDGGSISMLAAKVG